MSYRTPRVIDRRRGKRSPAGSLALLGASMLLVGCAAASDEEYPGVPGSAPEAFQHIHSLTADPQQSALLVGTHAGVYELIVDELGAATIEGPIGGLDFDPMGFTMRDDIAYASGHPGPTTPASFGSPHLGLIVSNDRGESWRTISLSGQTDFHDIAVGPPAVDAESDGHGTIYGLDTSKLALQRSFDGGASWSDGAELIARDIAADPATPGTLYATTEDGFAVSSDDGESFTVDTSAPPLYLVSIDPVTGTLAGIDTSGTVWIGDASDAWVSGGAVSGTPGALTISGDRIFVADERGIAFTDDIGETWTILDMTDSR